jgi:hypothetical protein
MLLGRFGTTLGASWAILDALKTKKLRTTDQGETNMMSEESSVTLVIECLLGSISEPFWGVTLVASWAVLRPSWWPLWTVLGASWSVLGPRRCIFGASLGYSWGFLELFRCRYDASEGQEGGEWRMDSNQSYS